MCASDKKYSLPLTENPFTQEPSENSVQSVKLLNLNCTKLCV